MGAHLVDPRTAETVEVLGLSVQYLTAPDGHDEGPCVMRGTIPAGGVVPLHSHADPETFLMVSGSVEGLVDADLGRWLRIGPGDVFHVPGDARHAWRNLGRDPAVMIVVSTNRMGRFLRELASAPEEFLETSERYGYWNATPEENAEIGVPHAG